MKVYFMAKGILIILLIVLFCCAFYQDFAYYVMADLYAGLLMLLSLDHFLADGTTFPQAAKDTIRDECSAVLLGAMGDPRVPRNEHAKDIIFGLRFGFDLYSNIRPVVCLHDRLMPLVGHGGQVYGVAGTPDWGLIATSALRSAA